MSHLRILITVTFRNKTKQGRQLLRVHKILCESFAGLPWMAVNDLLCSRVVAGKKQVPRTPVLERLKENTMSQ